MLGKEGGMVMGYIELLIVVVNGLVVVFQIVQLVLQHQNEGKPKLLPLDKQFATASHEETKRM
jgi:hypothetical protein